MKNLYHCTLQIQLGRKWKFLVRQGYSRVSSVLGYPKVQKYWKNQPPRIRSLRINRIQMLVVLTEIVRKEVCLRSNLQAVRSQEKQPRAYQLPKISNLTRRSFKIEVSIEINSADQYPSKSSQRLLCQILSVVSRTVLLSRLGIMPEVSIVFLCQISRLINFFIRETLGDVDGLVGKTIIGPYKNIERCIT